MTDAQEIKDTVNSLVSEVLKLRSSVSLPSASSVPQAVLDSLLDVRAKADRVEELSITVLRMRAQLGRREAALKALVEDSWAQALTDLKGTGSRQRDQYEGPRERYAEADLAVLSDKRTLRKLEELMSVVDEASDVIRVAFRGINDIMNDHRTWLRLIQLQPYSEK